jgi:hypothetical protein
MIKSSMEKHTISWLLRKSNEKALDFTISIQRREVWDNEHKSNLIGAILIGIPIESLLFEEDGEESNGYLVLDGKQRSLAILQFLRDQYAISDNCKVKEINGETIIGKKYSELPVDLQEALKEYELTIAVLRPLSEEERELIFFMRNQAVSLTKVELTRVLIGSKVLDVIEKIVEHPFLSKVNISSSKSNRYQDQQVILECLILEMGKDYSFSGKDLMEFAGVLRNEGIGEEAKNNLVATLDYLNKAIPKKNRSLRKIHIPMLYTVAKKAVSDGISGNAFFNWMEKFFKDIKEATNEYTEACSSRSAQKASIKARIKYMIEHYERNVA